MGRRANKKTKHGKPNQHLVCVCLNMWAVERIAVLRLVVLRPHAMYCWECCRCVIWRCCCRVLLFQDRCSLFPYVGPGTSRRQLQKWTITRWATPKLFTFRNLLWWRRPPSSFEFQEPQKMPLRLRADCIGLKHHILSSKQPASQNMRLQMRLDMCWTM